MNQLTTFISETKEILRQSVSTCLTLFKVMIPVIVIIKILQVFNLTQYVAMPLEPIMNLVGLPAEMGLVWAASLINFLYAGIVVLLSLLPDHPLTMAQATVLGTMMLLAHAFPMELKICQLSGPRMWFQGLFRFVSAVVIGFALHKIYSGFDLLQEPAVILLHPRDAADETLLQWAWGEVQNLGKLYLIILALMVLLRMLKLLRITDLMNAMLGPVLRIMGIGPKASSITIIGLTLGLSYGGGLIINEARSGELSRKDVFYSLTLMGVCHSIFEDTMLMTLIGGHASGLLWGRVIFSLIIIAVLVRFVDRLSEEQFKKFLWIQPAGTMPDKVSCCGK